MIISITLCLNVKRNVALVGVVIRSRRRRGSLHRDILHYAGGGVDDAVSHGVEAERVAVTPQVARGLGEVSLPVMNTPSSRARL